MKKSLLFISLLALSTSCSKSDPDTLVLSTSELSLQRGQSYQISVPSRSALSYETANEFHAVVSADGLVKAGYVGETDITVRNAEDKKELKVAVLPNHTLYEEPLNDFPLTKSQIIAKLGKPDYENGETIGYYSTSRINPIKMYLFDANQTLKSSAAAVSTTFSAELGKHLVERYLPVASRDYTLMFIDALTLNKAKKVVGASLSDSQTWLVIYMPNTANAREANSEDKKTLLNSLKAIREIKKI